MGPTLTFLGILVVIFVVGKVLTWPIKLILKLVINSLIGALVIYVLNMVGGGIGINVPLNIVTAAVVGIFGIPGAVVLVILSALGVGL